MPNAQQFFTFSRWECNLYLRSRSWFIALRTSYIVLPVQAWARNWINGHCNVPAPIVMCSFCHRGPVLANHRTAQDRTGKVLALRWCVGG